MKITMTGTDFNRIMRVCIPALSKDDVREELRHIDIQCNGEGEGCATALDGYTLAQTRFACQGPRCRFHIPPHKKVRNDCTIEITLEDEKISVSDGVETVTRPAYHGQQIDHAAICKGAQAKKKRATIAFDGRLLMRALKCHAGPYKEPVFLEIYGPNDAAILHTVNTCGMVLPMRIEPKEGTPVFWDMRENA